MALLGHLFIAYSRSHNYWNISRKYVQHHLYEIVSPNITKDCVISAGVILSNEPTPIESRQFSNEKVKSAGAFGVGGSTEKNRTSTSTISYTTESEAPTIPPAIVTTTISNIVYGK